MPDRDKIWSANIVVLCLIGVAIIAGFSACTNPQTGAKLSPYQEYETAQDLYATVYRGVLDNYDLGILDLGDLGRFVKAAKMMEASLKDWRAQLGDDGKYLTSESAARIAVVQAAMRRFLLEWQAKSQKSEVIPGRAPSPPGPSASTRPGPWLAGGGGGSLAAMALCLAAHAATGRRAA